jgi:glycosyltransferase involved in cell wall biosynthesis
MSEAPAVSVVISTYNRCQLLRGALESVLAQETGGVFYEVIVVDNNSTDRTREVVEEFTARGQANLRYVFEGCQGLSHARNAGIAEARAPLIAFTDDDVCAARNWVASIKRAFDKHPEVDCVGGKVLPRWPKQPPAWLTREHWPPLALVDYGETPFHTDLERPLCIVGANLSLRRSVFDEIGLFAPEYQLIKDITGSTEDYELQRRLWLAGRKGMYVPGIVVSAEVQTERLTKAYHRRWHRGHGVRFAAMRMDEIERSRSRLFDVPAHLYNQAMSSALSWMKCALRADLDRAFMPETRLFFIAGFLRRRYRDYRAGQSRGALRELARFAWALATKGGNQL